MNQEDKKFKNFLNSNESKIPEPNSFEFSKIRQKIEEDQKKKFWSKWMVWGPVALTLSCGLIFFASINRSMNEASDPASSVQLSELEEILFESYAYMDDLEEDFINPYWM